MSFAPCNQCPTFWGCKESDECLNLRVIRRTSELQLQIAQGLELYDAKRAEITAQRAADPKFMQPKVVDKKPICWHTFSSFGICVKPGCGYWKQVT